MDVGQLIGGVLRVEGEFGFEQPVGDGGARSGVGVIDAADECRQLVRVQVQIFRRIKHGSSCLGTNVPRLSSEVSPPVQKIFTSAENGPETCAREPHSLPSACVPFPVFRPVPRLLRFPAPFGVLSGMYILPPAILHHHPPPVSSPLFFAAIFATALDFFQIHTTLNFAGVLSPSYRSGLETGRRRNSCPTPAPPEWLPPFRPFLSPKARILKIFILNA